MEEVIAFFGAFIAAAGIPSAICGLLIWRYKRSVEKKDTERENKEKRREELMLMMMTSTRENTNLCIAIAKAVQRIPDAKCNGDMTAALARAEAANKREKDFLIQNGVEHIFE